MEASSLVALPAVLALELSEGGQPARHRLSRDEAAELAAFVAQDLRALLPQVEQARLAVAGALFDAVELLRPGFPVWATLDELARRVPRGHLEHVVAFGTHQGRMPAQPLEPEATYADGPMRLVPISLLAPAALAAGLGERMEAELAVRGEAGMGTSDWLMRTLGARLQHARYLSRNDLLALTCVQYEHVNLAPLWTLLEAALLTPYRPERALSARGLPLRYEDGRVLVPSPAQWLRETGHGAHELAGVLFELRQYAALLGAHQLPLALASPGGKAGEGWLYEQLAEPDPALDRPMLHAHEAPGLGIVAITAAQHAGGRSRLLAHGYPLQPQALLPLAAALAERYGAPDELHRLGKILLDEQGNLGAPAASLH